MKAHEIADVFEQIAPIESGLASDRANGFLGFRIGDPKIEVAGVGVAWTMSQEVLASAVRRKLNFLIIHEPELFRYYESPFHSNLQPMQMEFNRGKMKLLLEHNIAVYTAHTNWDLQKEVGMGPTLAAVLGFDDLLRWDIGVGVFKMPPRTTLGSLISRVKKVMGLSHVRYQGNEKMPVRTLVLGFGALGSEAEAILANGADAGVFGELREWAFIHAREAGVGIIETTHLRSESLGFASVVTEMRRRLPEVRFEFLETPPAYKLG